MQSLDIETVDLEYENPVILVGRKVVTLEESVISCLLQKPELMENLIVDESDFYDYPKIFKFFQEFYDKFKCLDLVLMANKIKPCDRYKLIEAVDKLKVFETAPSQFRLYQEALIEYNKEHIKELIDNQTKERILEKIVELNSSNAELEVWFEEIEKIKDGIKYE